MLQLTKLDPHMRTGESAAMKLHRGSGSRTSSSSSSVDRATHCVSLGQRGRIRCRCQTSEVLENGEAFQPAPTILFDAPQGGERVWLWSLLPEPGIARSEDDDLVGSECRLGKLIHGRTGGAFQHLVLGEASCIHAGAAQQDPTLR